MKISFLNGYVNGKNNKALLESEPNPPALRFPIFWKVLEQQLNREDPESGRSSLEQLSCVLFDLVCMLILQLRPFGKMKTMNFPIYQYMGMDEHL